MEVHTAGATRRPDAKRMMLVSHDLSHSGAPILLLQVARILLAADWDVTLLSFAPGELSRSFLDLGVPVLIDRNAGPTLRENLAAIGAAVDGALCNTVATRSAVEAIAPDVPSIWYLHEVSLLEEMLSSDASLARAIALPRHLWAGSELSARLVRPFRPEIAVVPYGLEPIKGAGTTQAAGGREHVRMAVFGSYEPRKGQDLLVQAFKTLPAEMRSRCRIDMFGRVLEQDYHARLVDDARDCPEIVLHDALTTDRYREEILASDAVIIPSRDDTLPLVSLDALGAGRVLMCTATTGTSAYLVPGKSGYVARDASARAIAAMLSEALAGQAGWPDVAAEGENVFRASFSTAAFADRLLGACDTMAADHRAGR
ncbi:glycosyltransferase family 4 protein [uncultured Sphingomonas sp.]|uniref:glycosyltransferase family 4 protein n=1 Tax=uncultured Sphingomonas sp. TaxID=158754 RepID=UPI0035C945F4